MPNQPKRKQQLRKIADKVYATIKKILTDPDRYKSTSDVTQNYKLVRRLIKKATGLEKEIFNISGLEDVYRTAYNALANIFTDINPSTVGFSPLPPKKSPEGFKALKDDFLRAMTEMEKMTLFNLNERQAMQKDTMQAIENGLNRRAGLVSKAKTKGIKITKDELVKLSNTVASQFAPATGVRKFRNEYYGLEPGSIDKKTFNRLWGKSWDELSQRMTGIIKNSIIEGEVQYKGVKKMLTQLENHFNTTHFPIPVRSPKTGELHIRRLQMRYYAEMKTRYVDQTVETKGTIDSMLDVGFDLVEYNIHGPQDHSEICLELSNNGRGKIYSLSGKSNQYPQLTVYPPAHYNCRSTIDPLPSDKQERYELTDTNQGNVIKTSVETPQTKALEFQKTGGSV